MSSMLEQLWPVFLAETSEQLEGLEAMLDRHGQRRERLDIDALFRDFHTLKSSFSMVDLRILVDLAHACEDVLHGLRLRGEPVSAPVKALLLETVDWLKQQLAVASPGHYPDQPNESLLSRLAPFRPVQEEDLAAPEPSPPPEPPPLPKAASLLEQERESLAVSHLRIQSDHLDDLVSRVGLIAQQAGAMLHALQDDSAWQSASGFQPLYRQLLTLDASIHSSLDGIQQTVLDLREIPLSTIFNKLPRIVRKRAGELGKQVQLVVDGGELLIDKGMIDEVTEPLVHILQNAIDHGIEPAEVRQAAGKPAVATLHITATEHHGLLRIEVRDDGRGIDWRTVRERVRQKGLGREGHDQPEYWLAFLFSREYHQLDNQDEDNASGLDRVRHRLTAIGGAMDIHSELGTGTCMTMRVPVTVAIQGVMLVEAAGQAFAVPVRNIQEICSLQPDQAEILDGQPILELRGNPLPLYPLSHLLQRAGSCSLRPRQEVLVLRHDRQWMGLLVDAIHHRQELFVRELHPDLRALPGVGGASLMGNGEVIIILDPESLFTLAARRPCPLILPGEGA